MINPSGAYDKKIKELYDELDEFGQAYDKLDENVAGELIDTLKNIDDTWTKKRPVQNLIIIDDSTGDFPSG